MLYDIVTFDCYGTLIDWDGGITSAFAEMVERAGVDVSPQELRAAYDEIEADVEAEAYRPYRDVLVETARRAAARFGWDLDPRLARVLPESLPTWRPFPDTNRALERLVVAGYRVGILSNVDDELLAGTREHLGVDFHLIVTAEKVGSYKPAHGHFLTAKQWIDGGRWLHAAQSYFHDIVPASELGIDSAWINRKAEEPAGDARPTREFRTVVDLADWLAPETT